MSRVRFGSALLLASIILTSWLGQSAGAEEQAPPASPYITPELIQDFARVLKVSPTDPELGALFAELQRDLDEQPFGPLDEVTNHNSSSRIPPRRSGGAVAPKGDTTPPDSRSLSTEFVRTSIDRHFRFSDGIPFAEAAPPEPSAEWRAGTRAAVQYFQEQIASSVKRAASMPPLPDCEKSSLERTEEPPSPLFGASTVRQDLLYLRGARPDDAQRQFGASVVVFSCGSSAGDECAVSKHITGVRCLPTRLIRDGQKVTRMEGARALRTFNFDDDLSRTTQRMEVSR
jgi:hypothetical protein